MSQSVEQIFTIYVGNSAFVKEYWHNSQCPWENENIRVIPVISAAPVAKAKGGATMAGAAAGTGMPRTFSNSLEHWECVSIFMTKT